MRGRNFGGSPVSISLLGNNIGELKAAKNAIKPKMEDNGLIKDITDNDPQGINEIDIKLKEKAYEQYRLGQITSLDFRTAQSNLLNAQTNYIDARYEAKLAELLIYQLAGKIQEAEF